jgi:hypothetical protein
LEKAKKKKQKNNRNARVSIVAKAKKSMEVGYVPLVHQSHGSTNHPPDEEDRAAQN